MKKDAVSISVVDYKNQEKYPIYVSKKCFEEKHVDLLLIEEKDKKYYVLVKDFNTFLYDHTLHCRRNHICCLCLQAFCTEKKLKSHINKSFQISVKQMIKMPKRWIC